jgi:16S rRNA (adenine1518-N6/adenine1519-N6)-dimethyltransferase
MPQSKHQIQSLLAEAGSQPRHRFGQNFMIDQNLVRLIAQAADLTGKDCIIEVGPGTGTLTEELLASGASLTAVEIDRDLARLLRDRHADNSAFRLIEGDALAHKRELNPELLATIEQARRDARPVKLVANLPYNIASPLVIELLLAGVDLLVFTVQKEVALRLRAGAGDDAYGQLSVLANLLARVEILRTLPPQAFWPEPGVESALVRMKRDDRLGASARPLSDFLHSLFSARRKTLRKSLTQAKLPADAMLAKAGIEPTLRPEELAPNQLLSLFEAQPPSSSTAS